MKIMTENDRVLTHNANNEGDIKVPDNFRNTYWFWDGSKIFEEILPSFVPCDMVVQNYSDEIRAHVY